MTELSPGSKEFTRKYPKFSFSQSFLLLAALLDSENQNEAAGSVGLTMKRANDVFVAFKSRFPDTGLFEKDGKAYVAGPHLREMEPELRQFMQAFDQLATRFSEIEEGRVATIRFGTYNPALKLFLAKAVGAFTKEEPHHRLQLPTNMADRRISSRELIDELRGNRLDCVVVPLREDDYNAVRKYKDLEIETLYRWDVVAVASPDDQLVTTGTDTVTAADLRGSPLLLAPKGFASRDAIDDGFAGEQIYPRCVHENPDTETRIRLALNGHGIALAPNDTIPTNAVGEAKWPKFLSNQKLVQGWYVLATLKKIPETPRIPEATRALLINHIRRAAADFRLERSLEAK